MATQVDKFMKLVYAGVLFSSYTCLACMLKNDKVTLDWEVHCYYEKSWNIFFFNLG